MPALVQELLVPLKDATHKECCSSNTTYYLTFEDQNDTSPRIITMKTPKLPIWLDDQL